MCILELSCFGIRIYVQLTHLAEARIGCPPILMAANMLELNFEELFS